jgi:predicted enzyme related to lactoylglutathione lyase
MVIGQPIVRCEIGCRDSYKTQDFYSNLFGWKIGPVPRQ